MKSLLSILSALLEDASIQLGADTSRDRETILDRVEHEGLAFVLITLPEFGSWLEQSLETNRALALIHSTFRRKPKSTKSVLPCFLQGLTSLVFDEYTGVLRSDANATAVFFIRQICYIFKKPKALANPKRIKKAVDQYRLTDLDVLTTPDIKVAHHKIASNLLNQESLDSGWLNWEGDRVKRVLEAVCNTLLPDLESAYLDARAHVLPKHGPGATADSIRGNAKYTVREWYKRWDTVFTHEELYGFPVELDEDLEVISPEKELPVRVIPVPKTYKTSRIISIEPTAMQFAQQMVLAKMVYAIERTAFGRMIKLSDQSQNRRLAKEGSLPGYKFSTIDLSEASDRVGAALVKHLLRKHCPTLTRELFAVRSSRALLPDEDQPICIRKYASMGSATTFPVESVIFAILAVAGVTYRMRRNEESGTPTRDNPVGLASHPRWTYPYCVRKATTLVSVFGDDIIVPNTAFKEVCQYLSAYGLKVNAKKSFAQGPFKESCGGDYYKGVDVTPVYCRTEAPGRPTDSESLISFVSLSNQLYEKGCWKASDVVKQMVEKIIGQLPLRRKNVGYLGWTTFIDATQFEGFDSNFSPWVRSYTVKNRYTKDRIDGNSALLKHFLSKMPQEMEDHLEQSVSRHSTRLRRGRLPA